MDEFDECAARVKSSSTRPLLMQALSQQHAHLKSRYSVWQAPMRGTIHCSTLSDLSTWMPKVLWLEPALLSVPKDGRQGSFM